MVLYILLRHQIGFQPVGDRLRTDFNGITLNMSKWPGLTIPFLIGANSTPTKYVNESDVNSLSARGSRNAYLTEAAWRNYNYIVIAPDGWNLELNGFNPTTNALVDFAQYIKLMGFQEDFFCGEVNQH